MIEAALLRPAGAITLVSHQCEDASPEFISIFNCPLRCPHPGQWPGHATVCSVLLNSLEPEERRRTFPPVRHGLGITLWSSELNMNAFSSPTSAPSSWLPGATAQLTSGSHQIVVLRSCPSSKPTHSITSVPDRSSRQPSLVTLSLWGKLSGMAAKEHFDRPQTYCSSILFINNESFYSKMWKKMSTTLSLWKAVYRWSELKTYYPFQFTDNTIHKGTNSTLALGRHTGIKTKKPC